jgi:DNA polymerase-1
MWKHLAEKGVELPKIRSAEINKKVEPVLRLMEKTGEMLDVPVLQKLEKKLKTRISKLEEEIYKLAGCEFNINSPDQMGKILFKKLKLSIKDLRKTKTATSTAASELLKLKGKHKIIEPILEYRELTKLVSTYLKPLPTVVDQDSRLHTTFGQDTSTGRMNSKNPNLQNIPIKGELGDEIRKAFIAAPGCKLISADYSQIELRIVACLAQDPVMMKAFHDKVDIHSKTASEIFNLPVSEITKDQRRIAKTVNFGVLYGMSAYGLSQSLNIPRERASDYINKYFSVHTGIANYVKTVKEKAHKEGCVETLFGFRRKLENIEAENWQVVEAEERIAINAPVQGTAAEVLKLAMIKLHSQLSRRSRVESRKDAKLILTVHDELVVEAPENQAEEIAKEMKEIMENVIKLCVPLEVEIGIGQNWFEAKR